MRILVTVSFSVMVQMLFAEAMSIKLTKLLPRDPSDALERNSV